MSILVVGSIAYDTVETPYGKEENAPGGSTLFFSSAASFFSPVNVVGVIGSDFDGSILSFLKKRGVDFKGLSVESGETFRWGGRYHANMNKRDTLFTFLNVFERFQPHLPTAYKSSEFVFLANIDPELQLDVLSQLKQPRLVVLDTMNFWISGKKQALLEVIAKSDIFILNDEEARELTGENNLMKAIKMILAMGPKALVVKKGEHGAMLIYENQYFFAPAFPLEEVKDPTGAGDTFAGGFVGYLSAAGELNLDNLRKAIIYGSTLASFAVEDFSFKRLIGLTKEEIEARVNRFREITSF